MGEVNPDSKHGPPSTFGLGLGHTGLLTSTPVGVEQIRGMVQDIQATPDPQKAPASKGPCSLAGKTVCFTGKFTTLLGGKTISRSQLESLVAQKGLAVAKGVSSKLDILVCADPNSMSGKAKRARQLGIRILAEPAFMKLIGLQA